ncbi:Mu transposase C-terminal domain-containing protein [Paracoccus sp. AK26]|uniref:Mu transposase C-terminal domain-containing protein n=1 Tax=Paracoccus sp. AK26 TaxID=2589076 RepID=UPI00142818BC|nr:Mu transposase C-terminal domain-containing protein [Paracoccus sp. AK26]QIR85101.1 hypothetical protein FIU66_07690 [Paracoccus sp. AK26]
MRIAFGVEVERKLAKDGIRVMNVRYHDVVLAQRFVRNIGNCYKVRFDPTNLGASEILDEGTWRELKAVDGRFEGVSATHWARAAAAVRRERARTEEEAAEVIWAAYSAIDQKNTSARLERGLIEDRWDADRLAQVEDRLTAFIRFREDPEAPPSDPLAMGIPTGTGERQSPRRNRGETGGIGRIEREDGHD